MREVTFGSLFAGIGGFDLGFELAGMVCKWQVERDEFCQQVLSRHWPNVPKFDDVTTFKPTAEQRVDVICGGFPCQDISFAGKGAALDGERSGLWFEFLRIIRELRPRFVVVENVSALLVRGMDRILGGLAESGYDAEWDCFQASAFGSYHQRDRVFMVAYPAGKFGRRLLEESGERRASRELGRLHRLALATRGKRENIRLESEPRLARLVHGVPNRTHRIAALGNSIVPAIAEWIGRRIVETSLNKEFA